MIPFRVMVITDWSLPDCVERVQAATRAGPGIAVQHRHPGATARTFFDDGLRLKSALGSTPLFVNDRLDVALALEAHLHLTDHSLNVGDVRRWLRGRWVSASWHPPDPPRTEVDLLLASPVFSPNSKQDTRPTLGADGFQRARRQVEKSVFALGGVDAASVKALQPLDGVAVIGGVLHAADPESAARAMLAAWGTP